MAAACQRAFWRDVFSAVRHVGTGDYAAYGNSRGDYDGALGYTLFLVFAETNEGQGIAMKTLRIIAVLLVVFFFAGQQAWAGRQSAANRTNIALLHLDLSGGPTPHNRNKIINAMRKAKDAGAEWIITPEMALQGYFFAVKDTQALATIAPYADVFPLRRTANELGVTLFLGCVDGRKNGTEFYNSCQVLAPEGRIAAVQHKKTGHPLGAEAWSKKGGDIQSFTYEGHRLGILVCSDIWYEAYTEGERIRDVDLLIAPAAWPDIDCGTGHPEIFWKRASVVLGVPLIVCNQTGHGERMNMDNSMSAVVMGDELVLSYPGPEEKILCLTWDWRTNRPLEKTFKEITP